MKKYLQAYKNDIFNSFQLSEAYTSILVPVNQNIIGLTHWFLEDVAVFSNM